jgi:GNAT superfamily N-acetyltransferase
VAHAGHTPTANPRSSSDSANLPRPTGLSHLGQVTQAPLARSAVTRRTLRRARDLPGGYADRSRTDPRNEIVVAEDDTDRLVAYTQVTYIPGLRRHGDERALLETVRVHSTHPGTGVGSAFIGWIIERARQHRCGLVQLTTDKRHTDAHGF